METRLTNNIKNEIQRISIIKLNEIYIWNILRFIYILEKRISVEVHFIK